MPDGLKQIWEVVHVKCMKEGRHLIKKAWKVIQWTICVFLSTTKRDSWYMKLEKLRKKISGGKTKTIVCFSSGFTEEIFQLKYTRNDVVAQY